MSEETTTLPPAVTGQMEIEPGTTAADLGVNADQVERSAPLDWDELPPFGRLGCEEAAANVLEVAEQVVLAVIDGEDGAGADWDAWGVFNGATKNEQSAIVRYVLTRRPTAEVLFNKVREWGFSAPEGPRFEDLLPVHRAGFELAVRIVPAVVHTIEAINTAIVEKNPPPAPAIAAHPVDIEDTILEQVDGLGDIDPERAAAQAGADRKAAQNDAPPKPKAKKGKPLSIDDGGEG